MFLEEESELDKASMTNLKKFVNVGKGIWELFAIFLQLFCKFETISKQRKEVEKYF